MEEASREKVDVNLSPEIKEKLQKLKSKLDNFTKEVLKKFDKEVVGIALLPPSKEEAGELKEKEKPKFNVLALIDDSNVKSREELIDKLKKGIDEISKDLEDVKADFMLISELKENCFDGKYEILASIASGAILFDKGILSALKVAEIHKSMAIKKFEKYVVSYVAAGSLFRGDSNPGDIDVYVVIDDTDVKKMSRAELKERLRAIIQDMGFDAARLTGIKATFHVQTYILTDFWDNVKDANPVIFTFLRDGVPLYDRGVFMPWKLLLKMGRIKPSPEAIDMNMDIGERLVDRAKQKLLGLLGEDIYYATLNPAQAALMLYGIPPPTPRETIKLLEEIFVKKEKLLEVKYVKILEKIFNYYKDIEHNKVKDVTGKQIDEFLNDVSDYLKRLRKLFNQIEKKSKKKDVLDMYDGCVAITKDLLMLSGKKDVDLFKIDKLFKEVLVDSGQIPEKFLRILKDVIKAKKDFDLNKLTKQEVDKVSKEARLFMKTLVEYLQRKKIVELERAKIRFKCKDKIGEILLFEDTGFIFNDAENREDVRKVNVMKDGGLTDLKKSSLQEFDGYIDTAKFSGKVVINDKLLNSLKELLKGEVELLLNY